MFNITDPMGQLSWFITLLDNAEKTGEKVTELRRALNPN